MSLGTILIILLILALVGRLANLGIQQFLGLRPWRHCWPVIGHNHYPGSAGTNMTT